MSDELFLQPLTQEQRIQAQKNAKKNVIALAGKKPERSDYNNSADQKYPAWLIQVVVALCLLMLGAAFLPSAIRLYDEGSRTFGASIPDERSMIVAGICTILLAEIGSVLFTMGLSVLNLTRITRIILIGSAVTSAVIALAGNYFVAIHDKSNITVFNWLEAMTPPLLTLATAYVLKEVSLHAIAARHADNQLFRQKLREWEIQTLDPENHPKWRATYANDLQDKLKKVNIRKFTQIEIDSITNEQWRMYIEREFAADSWFDTNTATNERRIRPNIRKAEYESRTYNEFTPNEQRTNGNGNHAERNMSAKDLAIKFFMENPEKIEMKLDDLVGEISQWAEQKVGRTSIHEARRMVAIGATV